MGGNAAGPVALSDTLTRSSFDLQNARVNPRNVSPALNTLVVVGLKRDERLPRATLHRRLVAGGRDAEDNTVDLQFAGRLQHLNRRSNPAGLAERATGDADLERQGLGGEIDRVVERKCERPVARRAGQNVIEPRLERTVAFPTLSAR